MKNIYTLSSPATKLLRWTARRGVIFPKIWYTRLSLSPPVKQGEREERSWGIGPQSHATTPTTFLVEALLTGNGSSCHFRPFLYVIQFIYYYTR